MNEENATNDTDHGKVKYFWSNPGKITRGRQGRRKRALIDKSSDILF